MPPSTSMPGCSRPERMARAIDPAPRKAMAGSVTGRRHSCDHPRIGGMSASGGGKAIIAAFLANMGIAVTKFIAWFFSGSASMLAEACTRVADSGNQLLLLLGGRQAQARGRQGASVRLRPRALRLRVRRVDHPVLGRRPVLDLRGHRQAQPPARARRAVDADRSCSSIAIVLESFSLRTAVKECNHVRGKRSWVAVRAPRQGARAARRAARGRRRAHRPGVRALRRRPHVRSPATRSSTRSARS